MRIIQGTLASVRHFAQGVTTIFVLLGMGTALVGARPLPITVSLCDMLRLRPWAYSGCIFWGVIRVQIPYREARVGARTEPTAWLGAYLTDLAFGFLLLLHGLGMTSPFVIAALFSRPFLRFRARGSLQREKAERSR